MVIGFWFQGMNIGLRISVRVNCQLVTYIGVMYYLTMEGTNNIFFEAKVCMDNQDNNFDMEPCDEPVALKNNPHMMHTYV